MPLVLVVLGTGGGVGWALAFNDDRNETPTSTTVMAGPVEPTNASRTVPTLVPTTAVPPRSTRTTVDRTSTTVDSTSTSASRSTSTTQPRSLSLLSKTMTRPDGVAALMDVGFGAGPGDEDYCRDNFPKAQRPTIATEFDSIEVAQPLTICLLGFSTDAPIQVTIQYPGGRLEQITAPKPTCKEANCTSEAAWAALPGDALGRYGVTAVQGKLTATGRITVKPAELPNLMVIGSPGDIETRFTARPGTTIGIALAGFGPPRSLDLLFYYTPSFEWCAESCTTMQFRAATTVTLDPSGGAIYWLRTSPTDPRGCYGINTMPPLEALWSGSGPPYPQVWSSTHNAHQFCLRR